MKRLAYFAAVLAIGCAGFAGCNKDENKTAGDNRTPGQKAGEAIDATTQKASTPPPRRRAPSPRPARPA